ncbi:hypothetical protein GGR50DRAFT_626983 [Xylaria sp. CBS 124048]|nr:hypothetical protein GGR50DRAFT_626983 [Xylaria sp. CBS 124048]
MTEKQEMDQPQMRRRRRDGSSSNAQQRQCPHCGRVFKRSEHLERHVRTHTKEKPYICHCGSAFSRRDLLTRHVRISHETNDGTSKSPDAPISDEGQQLHSEPATPNAPTLEFASDRNAPQGQYPDGLEVMDHTGGSYHQLSPRQEYYHQGQPYSTYDQYTAYTNAPDTGGVSAHWSPYYHDQATEQDMVDPSLRGSMGGQTSPLHHSEFPDLTYNQWMSTPQQHWGN